MSADPSRPIPLIILTGPTAVGKTGLALELAGLLEAEIVGADSLQVYKLMDIGTAKPTPEELRKIPHHLIDLVYPDEPFHAGRYRKLAIQAIGEINGRGKKVLVVGGTGLYLRALLEGLMPCPEVPVELRTALYGELDQKGEDFLFEQLKQRDPEAAAAIHPHDHYRVLRALEIIRLTGGLVSQGWKKKPPQEIFFRPLKIGLYLHREELYSKINNRCIMMLKKGFLEEVRHLIELGYSPDLKPIKSLGYKQMAEVISGRSGLDAALDAMQRETRRYAKRQMTWFRKEREMHWFNPQEKEKIFSLARWFINDPETGIEGAGTCPPNGF